MRLGSESIRHNHLQGSIQTPSAEERPFLQINRNIRLHSEQNRHCAPEGRHDELSQHETEEKGCRPPKTTDATVFRNNPLQDETHEERKPEEIHRKGAGDGITRRMERHPHPPSP